jgi:hypothetical protein
MAASQRRQQTNPSINQRLTWLQTNCRMTLPVMAEAGGNRTGVQCSHKRTWAENEGRSLTIAFRSIRKSRSEFHFAFTSTARSVLQRLLNPRRSCEDFRHEGRRYPKPGDTAFWFLSGHVFSQSVSRFKICGTREFFPSHRSDALYQGTTSVGP